MIASLLALVVAQAPESSITLQQSILLATGTVLVGVGVAWGLLRGGVADLKANAIKLDAEMKAAASKVEADLRTATAKAETAVEKAEDRLRALESDAAKSRSDIDALARSHYEVKAEFTKSENRILDGMKEQLLGFRREIEALLRSRP